LNRHGAVGTAYGEMRHGVIQDASQAGQNVV